MKVFAVTLLLLLSAVNVFNQEAVATVQKDEGKNYVEVRLGFTEEGLGYREVDYVRSFDNGMYVNLNYSGATGQNEAWVGAGYSKEVKENFTLGGGVYLVVGKEREQLGVGLATFGEAKVKKLNLAFQVAAYLPVKGGVPKYLTIDSLDATYQVTKRVEVGGSFGTYFEGKDSNVIAGPLVRINDKLGHTSFYVRGGAYTEFRISRTFIF